MQILTRAFRFLQRTPTPEGRPHNRLSAIVDALAVCLILAAGAALVTRPNAHEHDDPEVVTDVPRGTTLSLQDLPTLGSPDAALVMVEFSDYLCRFCIRFSHDTFPRIREQFIDRGKLAYAFVHSPISTREPLSAALSKASICAHRQGLFWPVHERLFDGPHRDLASALAALHAIGIDRDVHARCLQDASAAAALERDLRSGDRLGVTATPSFLIGRRSKESITWVRKIKGSQPFSVFTRVLSEAEARRFWWR